MNRLSIMTTLAAAILASVPSFAHHSHAMFDRSKEITVTGVVKEFQYTNPHSWLMVDVKNEDGTVTTWGFEGNTPSILGRAGIYKGDFPAGTKVTVTGNPMFNGAPAATWNIAVRGDGKVFDWRPPTGEPDSRRRPAN